MKGRELLAAFLVGFSAGCCTQPGIDVASYRYLREDPAEAVRFFQLAVELGQWEEAASCLVSQKEAISPWELWIASGMAAPELGAVSLNQIIVGAFFFGEPQKHGAEAVVAVLSRPTKSVYQQYDLLLVQKGKYWYVDLDGTLRLNMPPER